MTKTCNFSELAQKLRSEMGNLPIFGMTWLCGAAPAEMAHLVYRLARGKYLFIAKAILNGPWLCGLLRISNEATLAIMG
jgi:hypothetical protein